MKSLSARDPSSGPRPKTSVTDNLLHWYDANRRVLPWRARPGERANPYHVWLSEIMLQQTTVAAVQPYFARFIARWPDVRALAEAELDDILGAWSGLGYYSRARNLHRAARIVVRDHGGVLPRTAAEWRTLPGAGAYTAAAIAAIAFGERVAAVDANAERVIARLFAVESPLPKARVALALAASSLVPEQRPGDFAQALMDFGSAVCLPKRPLCGQCPVAAACRGRAGGIAEDLPRKAPKRARPLKRGAAFVAFDRDGAVYLVRRPEKGVLGAMLQPPTSEWVESFPERAVALEMAPFMGNWIKQPGIVRHVFTHFVLEMEVWSARFESRPNGEGRWLPPPDWKTAALPTLMHRVIAHAREDETPARQLSSARTR